MYKLNELSKDDEVESRSDKIQADQSPTVENTADVLDPITEICLQIYPDQVDVLQATSKVQYWLNGPDPLDYINIYVNNDDENKGENSHFHYVSLGLSDLYGDERVHKKSKSSEEPSGYGYELTIRVRRENASQAPPKWPIKLLQGLARYTFTHGVLLDAGDHVPNVLAENNNRIKHLLVTRDPQLPFTQTRFGYVNFLQIVGCTDDELLFAQQWSASKIIEIMRDFKELGNSYLITCMNRNKSIFELNPELKKNTIKSIKRDGSNLSFVKSNCFWIVRSSENPQAPSFIQNRRRGSQYSDHYEDLYQTFTQLDLYIDVKTALLFSIILKQRLEKDSSFILNGIDTCNLILVPENFQNSNLNVNTKFPLKTNGTECQMLINKKAILNMRTFFHTVKTWIREMKLTIDYLKQESCNFDLECIFILDLSNKNIKDLDHIKDCINLEILNLSSNEINHLLPLKSLTKLQYLNLACNQIKYLDGIETLESLRTLNLSGNHLDSLEEFYKLRALDSLYQLTLTDFKRTYSNPICSYNKNYKNDIHRILPKLELIDGESFNSNSRNQLKNFEEIFNKLTSKNGAPKDEINYSDCSEPWLTNSYAKTLSSNPSRLISQLDQERSKFNSTYNDIKKSIKDSCDIVDKIQSKFSSADQDEPE